MELPELCRIGQERRETQKKSGSTQRKSIKFFVKKTKLVSDEDVIAKDLVDKIL